MGYIKCNELQNIINDEIINPSGNGISKPSQYVYNCSRRLQDLIQGLCCDAFNEGCAFESNIQK